MLKINKRVTFHICTKDRHSELALLLESLRTLTYQEWDIVIVDESQGFIMNNHLINCLINKIKLEGHYVNILQNKLPLGVCNARNIAIKQDYFENDYICRVDDDVILEPNYLNLLMDVIKKGYDIASGVTPTLAQITIKRKAEYIGNIINKKEFDEEGNLIKHGDDCGVLYCDIKEEVVPAHEFRSCALIKKEVIEKVKYEKNLSPVGFREEAFFSFRSIALGFKIGVHLKAIAWHFQSPAGGCRYTDYPQKVQSDDRYFQTWVKELYNNNEKFRKIIQVAK